MSTETWLIAYDVRKPRRLVRAHRRLARQATPVQYSLFTARRDAPSLDALLAEVAAELDLDRDDLRAYGLTRATRVETFGRHRLPDGVWLFGPALMGLTG